MKINYQEVVSLVADQHVVKATKYISDKLIVRATRKLYNGMVVKGNVEMYLTIGRPNYAEREFIKMCKKAGEKFPVKKIQIKTYKPKK